MEAARIEKSRDAFRTISEVAGDLDVPQHVLRFWETRFAHIKPLKRAGGRRYYRPDDVDLLRGIRHLLYGQGYTIKGVQRILKAEGIRFVQSIGRGEQTVVAPPRAEQAEAPTAEEDAEEPGAAIQRRLSGEWSEDGEAGPPAMPEPDAPPPRDARLAPAILAVLQVALDELLECERVLATLWDRPTGDADHKP